MVNYGILIISASQDNYDIQFVQQVYNTSVVTLNELKNGLIRHDKPVRIQYNTKDSYKITAKMLGLMDDFKVKCNTIIYLNLFLFTYCYCQKSLLQQYKLFLIFVKYEYQVVLLPISHFLKHLTKLRGFI